VNVSRFVIAIALLAAAGTAVAEPPGAEAAAPPAGAPPPAAPPGAVEPPARPPGAPSPPGATPPASPPGGTASLAGAEPGYCRYVKNAAASEAALLSAPELFGTVGVFQIAEGDTGTAFGRPKTRITLGAEASLAEMLQGVAVRQRADAECRRWRAMNSLEGALQAGTGIGTAPALAARAAVLDEALPLLEKRLGQLRDQVKLAMATVEELDAAQLRADELRDLAARTAVERARAEKQAPPAGTLPDLLSEYRAADDEVERLEGRLRKSGAWDLKLRGGYDEILNVSQTLPVFAALTLSYDLGNLWQHGADRNAREGRRAWIQEESSGVDSRLDEMLGALRTSYEVERARLTEVETLRRDLEGQLRTVEALQTSQVRRFRDYLYLELTRIRAEHAYLEKHVAALQGFLGTAR
jgi:hypothetical protein